MSGGLKDNAIPRAAEAELVLCVSTLDEVRQLQKKVDELSGICQRELSRTDPNVRLELEAAKEISSVSAMTGDVTKKVVAALVSLPGGVQRMSADIEGLVQTSLNLGKLVTEEGKVLFSFAVRSSVETLTLREESASTTETEGGPAAADSCPYHCRGTFLPSGEGLFGSGLRPGYHVNGRK